MADVTINEDILIDRNNLDLECEEAPGYYDFWQTQESNLEAEIGQYEADLSRRIRQTPEHELRSAWGLPKLTDAAVNAVIKADAHYNDLKRQYNQAYANRRAWEKKIGILDTLARLHSSGYFAKIESKPLTRKVVAEKMADRIREAIANIREQNGNS